MNKKEPVSLIILRLFEQVCKSFDPLPISFI